MPTDAPITSLEVSTERAGLDRYDEDTLRSLYSETQQWSRHYETLVVNANVLLISVSLLLVGLAFGEAISTEETLVLLFVPVLMALVGVALTETLFRLYATCVQRMTLYENAFNCFDRGRGVIKEWDGRMLPESIIELPVRRPPSVRFFLALYCVLVTTYAILAVLKAT